MEISRLERIPLRELWPNEAVHFTTWLAENLDFLGEALGMALSLVEQEAFQLRTAPSQLLIEGFGGNLQRVWS